MTRPQDPDQAEDQAQDQSQQDGQVSELAPEGDRPDPISPSDATAGAPDAESGEPDEGTAGPDAPPRHGRPEPGNESSR